MLVITSCNKDLGNYKYVDINEVNISSLGGPYKLIYKVDTLRITPVLEFSQDSTDNRFEYEWRVGKFNNVNDKRQLISNERNLEYAIDLLPGTYSVYYNVYDKITDVTRSTFTTLEVTTNVSKGFFITGENEDGFADVDFISMPVGDTLIMRRLLNNNNMPKYRNPIATIHTGTTGYNTPKLWFMTGDGGYYLNTNDFTTSASNDFYSLIFSNIQIPRSTYPVDVAPRVANENGLVAGVASRIVLSNNGDIFASNISSRTDFYGNPVNRLSSRPDETFRCAPFLIYPALRMDKFVVFDDINNRFLFGTAGGSPGSNLTILTDASQNPFPWNQETNGRKVYYAENTKNTENGGSFGNSYALMKDDVNEFHIYKFYATGFSAPVKLNYYKVSNIAIDIDKSNLFTFSSNQKVLFYTVGSKLYAYDYNAGLEKIYLIKDFGDEITMIKCDIQQGNGSQLYVATYNSVTKGTVHKYLTNSDLNNLVMTEDQNVKWEGLLKVKSMTWRNSSQ